MSQTEWNYGVVSPAQGKRVICEHVKHTVLIVLKILHNHKLGCRSVWLRTDVLPLWEQDAAEDKC